MEICQRGAEKHDRTRFSIEVDLLLQTAVELADHAMQIERAQAWQELLNQGD